MADAGLLLTVWRVVKGAWRGAVNLARMPQRLSALERRPPSPDPRPVCTSCGTGRVSSVSKLGDGLYSAINGRCDQCGARWQVSPDGARLQYFQGPGAH